MHSFDPDTPVLLASGTAVAISEVEVGDEVLATDPETGETGGRRVTALHVNDDTDLADVTIVDTETGEESVLHTTQHHPFWSATDKDWVYAADLQPGDRLRDDEGKETQQVVAVKTWTGLQQMRDLTVDDLHVYYVVPEETSKPVLVHNCKGNGRDWENPDKWCTTGNCHRDGFQDETVLGPLNRHFKRAQAPDKAGNMFDEGFQVAHAKGNPVVGQPTLPHPVVTGGGTMGKAPSGSVGVIVTVVVVKHGTDAVRRWWRGRHQ